MWKQISHFEIICFLDSIAQLVVSNLLSARNRILETETTRPYYLSPLSLISVYYHGAADIKAELHLVRLGLAVHCNIVSFILFA